MGAVHRLDVGGRIVFCGLYTLGMPLSHDRCPAYRIAHDVMGFAHHACIRLRYSQSPWETLWGKSVPAVSNRTFHARLLSLMRRQGREVSQVVVVVVAVKGFMAGLRSLCHDNLFGGALEGVSLWLLHIVFLST